MTHHDYVMLSYLCGALALIAIIWQTCAIWREYYKMKQQERDQ